MNYLRSTVLKMQINN